MDTGTRPLGTLPCSSESVWSEGACGLRMLGGVTHQHSHTSEKELSTKNHLELLKKKNRKDSNTC